MLTASMDGCCQADDIHPAAVPVGGSKLEHPVAIWPLQCLDGCLPLLEAVCLNWSQVTSIGHNAAWTCLRTKVMLLLLLLWDILSSVAGGLPSPMAMLTSWKEVFEACITYKAASVRA